MPALSNAQEQRLRNILEQLSKKQQDAALASADSFLNFVKEKANDIWKAIKDIMTRIWSEISNLFS
jgi:phage-related protein